MARRGRPRRGGRRNPAQSCRLPLSTPPGGARQGGGQGPRPRMRARRMGKRRGPRSSAGTRSHRPERGAKGHREVCAQHYGKEAHAGRAPRLAGVTTPARGPGPGRGTIAAAWTRGAGSRRAPPGLARRASAPASARRGGGSCGSAPSTRATSPRGASRRCRRGASRNARATARRRCGPARAPGARG